ncbi:hypothetical protein [Nodularia sp. NIES-3585]|nr:hypothetical protein [Nodularia sp. NIES-3585]
MYLADLAAVLEVITGFEDREWLLVVKVRELGLESSPEVTCSF